MHVYQHHPQQNTITLYDLVCWKQKQFDENSWVNWERAFGALCMYTVVHNESIAFVCLLLRIAIGKILRTKYQQLDKIVTHYLWHHHHHRTPINWKLNVIKSYQRTTNVKYIWNTRKTTATMTMTTNPLDNVDNFVHTHASCFMIIWFPLSQSIRLMGHYLRTRFSVNHHNFCRFFFNYYHLSQ